MDLWVRRLFIILSLIWIAIGLIVLGSILYIFINKPNLSSLKSLMPSPSTSSQNSSVSTGVGGLTEKQLLQKYNSLTQDQKDCVKSAVGEQRFNQIMSRSVKPTQDDLQKAQSCI